MVLKIKSWLREMRRSYTNQGASRVCSWDEGTMEEVVAPLKEQDCFTMEGK